MVSYVKGIRGVLQGKQFVKNGLEPAIRECNLDYAHTDDLDDL
jgi:hypothetical protein